MSDSPFKVSVFGNKNLSLSLLFLFLFLLRNSFLKLAKMSQGFLSLEKHPEEHAQFLLGALETILIFWKVHRLRSKLKEERYQDFIPIDDFTWCHSPNTFTGGGWCWVYNYL